MAKPPNKPVSTPKSPIQKPAPSRTGRSASSSQKALRDSVTQFATDIREKHGLLDRKAAERICRRLHYLITPPQRKGRPPEQRITEATRMYESQQRQANGGRVNWNEIAQRCIPGYSGFRSVYHRRTELSKLRSAVYARLGRRDTNKRSTDRKTE